MGLFDPPSRVPMRMVADSELMSPQHRALALRPARESMVLLKNNGALPLKPGVRRIAVVGPLADQVDVLLGNYNGQPKNPVTALAGIRAAFPNATITFEPGTNFLRALETVPSSVLTTPDGQPGLKGDYYKGADFVGAPALSRVDANIGFDRDTAPVLPDAGPLSVRWTGALSVPESGTYSIGLDGQNSKLWIDGKLVVDSTAPRQRSARTTDMAFEKGRKYEIKSGTDTCARPHAEAGVVAGHRSSAGARGGGRKGRRCRGRGNRHLIGAGRRGDECERGWFCRRRSHQSGYAQGRRRPAQCGESFGKKLVVVLMNGSALSVNWAAKNADAIVDAWYPGEEGGEAIAQTLSGSNNPSGHLPVTFYTGVDQLPPFDSYDMKGRTYRYFAGKPLYPFGYGLSFTKFTYGGLKLPPPESGRRFERGRDGEECGRPLWRCGAASLSQLPQCARYADPRAQGIHPGASQSGRKPHRAFRFQPARSLQRDRGG